MCHSHVGYTFRLPGNHGCALHRTSTRSPAVEGGRFASCTYIIVPAHRQAEGTRAVQQAPRLTAALTHTCPDNRAMQLNVTSTEKEGLSGFGDSGQFCCGW